jgi:hypothetical protein
VPYFIYRPTNRSDIQRQAGAGLRSRTCERLKEALQQHREIEEHIEALKLSVEKEYHRWNDNADILDNIDSSHGE